MAYGFYKSIEIKYTAVEANETNIPVALVVTDSDFATESNGGKVQNTDGTGGASGSLTVPADFTVCTDKDDITNTTLDFEFVDYDETTGYIEIWVEVDSLSATTNTTIYFVFGDSGVTASQENVAGTWGNGYAAVWHMGEASGTIYDSTDNADSSTESITYGHSGQIGDCPEWDGEDDYITDGSPSAADDIFAGGGTVSAWEYPHSDGGGNMGRLIKKGWLSYVSNEEAGVTHARFGHPFSGDAGSWRTNSKTIDINTWNHVVITYNRDSTSNDPTFYVDGVNAGTNEYQAPTGSALSDSSYDIILGNEPDGSRAWDGYLDEIFISSVARDADWITTTYNNQDNPEPDGTFWTALGATESYNEAPTAPTDLETESQTNPTGVSDLTPEFTAVLNDPDDGDTLTHVYIQVGTTEDSNDMWDSGWIDITDVTEGDRCEEVSYDGTALSKDGSTYYWRIRARDEGGLDGEWSTETATFEMADIIEVSASFARSLSDQYRRTEKVFDSIVLGRTLSDQYQRERQVPAHLILDRSLSDHYDAQASASSQLLLSRQLGYQIDAAASAIADTVLSRNLGDQYTATATFHVAIQLDRELSQQQSAQASAIAAVQLARSLDDIFERHRAVAVPYPDEGCSIIWMSDGTGAGDRGDIMVRVTVDGVTKEATLISYSDMEEV